MATKLAPPWFIVRKSRIHGEGVFAAREIPKGTRVIEYVGERITKAEAARRSEQQVEMSKAGDCGAVYIFESTLRHDIDGNVPWNPARLINHSCKPNCAAKNLRGRIWISAVRAIPEGAELSYDYGYDIDHYSEHPCRCGSLSCCGFIVGKSYRKKLAVLLKRGL
ncbi:MAG: SET domain-containing protein-lysine N-methyltransferase [Blastochloris sp.]|nr:SET domain-containing protein-lysine N-methyltransferase [Blastochloris sp.]